MENYEVIVIGGGPVGMALGVELGLLNIKALVIEKYPLPQQLPRAQLLNPRSLEFFRRWGINNKLINKKLLPDDFPLQATWCSGLNGVVYSSVNMAEHLTPDLTPESYLRIPLWLTEEVLESRLSDLKTVCFLKGYEAVEIHEEDEKISLVIENKLTGNTSQFSAKYVVGCDGANSFLRQKMNIPWQIEMPAASMLNITFKSHELSAKISVPQSVLYYNLARSNFGCIGCVDINNGLWYALAASPQTVPIDELDVAEILNELAGFNFEKEILQRRFWMREAKIVERFRHKRMFLAGDAAHVIPPMGGHGLNTGLGDVVNLGWKLAAVLSGQASEELLDSYEMERRPVALRNISIAKKNAEDAANIRKNFPPEIDAAAFARENQRVALQHAQSHGVALGYQYVASPHIFYDGVKCSDNLNFYEPRALPGFFTPHIPMHAHSSIYDMLGINFVLVTRFPSTEAALMPLRDAFKQKNIELQIVQLGATEQNSLYNKTYYLLRPDWHIAWMGNNLPEDLEHFMNTLMPL